MGKNIKRLMEENKINVYALAKTLGVSPVSVYAWVDNKHLPHFNKIKKLAAIFNCKVSEITGEE